MNTVLISGGTGGIGRETALLLARSGYRVFAGYRREAKGVEILLAAEKEKLPLSILPLDITLPHQANEAVNKILRETGRIDVLINNAGYGLGGPLEELEIDEIRAQFETNVFGHIRLTQAVLPAMRKQKVGTIIFLSSVSGRLVLPYFGAYSASKHAIEAIGEALRYEFTPFGIRTVLVEPGMIRTEFVQKNLVVAEKAARSDSPYYATGRAIKEKYWAKDETSPHPEIVAKKILDILKHKNPRLRYQVGGDSALLVALKKIMSDRLIEFLMLKFYSLRKP